jgi:hypothetical protein
MSLRNLLAATLLAWSLASPSRAGVVVPLGGRASEIVADPARRAFYVGLDTGELVVVDADFPAITVRIALPMPAGSLALDADSDRLFVSQGPDVGAIDLSSLSFAGMIDLTATQDVRGMALGPPGRLIAGTSTAFHFLDTIGLREVAAEAPTASRRESGFILDSGAGGSLVYQLNKALTPASMYAYDVSADTLCFVGEDVCHGCLGPAGVDLVVAPAGGSIYACFQAGQPFEFRDAPGVLGPKRAVLVGTSPRALAISPLSGEAHATRNDPGVAGSVSVVTFDVADGLP